VEKGQTQLQSHEVYQVISTEENVQMYFCVEKECNKQSTNRQAMLATILMPDNESFLQGPVFTFT